MTLSPSPAAPTTDAQPTQQPQTPLGGIHPYTPAVTGAIGRLLDSPDRRPSHPTFNSAV